MSTSNITWNPRAQEVLNDQIGAYDILRRRCPVAHSDYLPWTLFRHADVLRVLNDPYTFSSVVPTHISVPNGMDPPEHTAYRKAIESYFGAERMKTFEPVCRRIVRDLLESAFECGELEVMSVLAHPLSVQFQCGFLNWPSSLHAPLEQWMRKNHQATLTGDRQAMAAIAYEFDGYIRTLLQERRSLNDASDITSMLMREHISGRKLNDDEIVSILRNWTVGELGTIAASIGILMHYLATHPEVENLLRDQPSLIATANDEILRMHAPLISSRRTTTRPVCLGGQHIEANKRITLLWASANRDEAVFGDPDEFRLDRNPSDNLLYGAGIHVCPGAPLARLELQVFIEELLSRTGRLKLVSGASAVKAHYPGSGFSSLVLRLEP